MIQHSLAELCNTGEPELQTAGNPHNIENLEKNESCLKITNFYLFTKKRNCASQTLARTIVTEKKFQIQNKILFELNLQRNCHFFRLKSSKLKNRKNRKTALQRPIPSSGNWEKQINRTTKLEASLIYWIKVEKIDNTQKSNNFYSAQRRGRK